MVWLLQGTERQREIIRGALDRTSYPWLRLLPGLAERVGRDHIPVEWIDLARFASAARAHGDGLTHISTADGKADVLAHRSRVLGLAWYSGKVSIERTLVDNPELAGEVFLSEGAHMVDFFEFTNRDRVFIWNVLHDPEDQIPEDTDITNGVDLGHGHGWFDVGSYYSWVGEAWMGLFVKAFSDYEATIDFVDHPPTLAALAATRRRFLEPPASPPTGPLDPVGPTGCLPSALRMFLRR